MIIVIIQARMGSSRLPGKVLKEINKVPILKLQIDRVRAAVRIDKVVVATTTEISDDKIENFCMDNDIDCFRGSENDVLSRYYECAAKFKASVVVRLTADCTLCDPSLIDDVIDLYFKKDVDYAANTVPPETSLWPDGSDVEVFSFKALESAYIASTSIEEREHVTFFFWKNKKNKYKIAQLGNDNDWSQYRFTIDYPEDYQVVKLLFDEIHVRGLFGNVHEIVSILDSKPEIKKLNEKYYFGIGWTK